MLCISDDQNMTVKVNQKRWTQYKRSVRLQPVTCRENHNKPARRDGETGRVVPSLRALAGALPGNARARQNRVEVEAARRHDSRRDTES